MVISTNTAQAIRLANDFWLPTGVASIVLLIVVCYVGWWYQIYWRIQFNNAAKELLKNEEKRRDDARNNAPDSTPGGSAQTEKKEPRDKVEEIKLKDEISSA